MKGEMLIRDGDSSLHNSLPAHLRIRANCFSSAAVLPLRLAWNQSENQNGLLAHHNAWCRLRAGKREPDIKQNHISGRISSKSSENGKMREASE